MSEKDMLAKLEELSAAIDEAKREFLESVDSLSGKLDEIQKQKKAREHSPYAPFFAASGVALFTISVAMVSYSVEREILTPNHLSGWLLMIGAGLMFAWNGLSGYIPQPDMPWTEFRRKIGWRNIRQNPILFLGLGYLIASGILLAV